MKRVLVAITFLTLVLTVTLGWRIRVLEAYKQGPAGGTGTIEGVDVNITSRMGARIVAIHVREGDEVKPDQVLVQRDCSEPEALLAEANARLVVAESSVESTRAAARAAVGNTEASRHATAAAAAQIGVTDAQKEGVDKQVKRIAALHSAGAIGEAELENLTTQSTAIVRQIDMAKANEQAARARAEAALKSQVAAETQINIARNNVLVAQAAVRRAELAVAECTLKAPRSGVVLRRNYEPGEVVLPGSNVLTIVDLDEVRTTFYLPNAELASAAPGKAVQVHADAYPNEAFTGRIQYVAAKAEFTPRNVQTREDRDRLVYGVEVTIPNATRKLRPGMPVEVSIEGTAQ